MLFAKSGISATANRRAVLITFVQSVISPFNEHFSPFNERCGEECGYRAENHLLKKSRPHLQLKKQR
jgi:hypothetical protein